MKFNFRLPILVATTAVSLFACSPSKNADDAVTLKPASTSISGDLSDYLQIVDGQYQIQGMHIGDLAVKIKALKPMTVKMGESRISASFFTKEGTPLSGVNMANLNMDSESKLVSLLAKGSGEEVLVISVNGWNNDMADKAVTFSLSSSYTKAEATSDDESSPAPKSLSDSGPEEYDQALDEFEKSVDAYANMVSSMDANNPAGMASAYADAMTSLMDVAQRLEDAKKQGEMSPAQLSRFVKIQGKQVEAMNSSKAMKQAGL